MALQQYHPFMVLLRGDGERYWLLCPCCFMHRQDSWAVNTNPNFQYPGKLPVTDSSRTKQYKGELSWDTPDYKIHSLD